MSEEPVTPSTDAADASPPDSTDPEPERKPASGIPARGYSWPAFREGNQVGRQFEPGNQIGPRFEPGNAAGEQFGLGNEAAMRHGAFSPRKLEPLANAIVEWALTLAAATDSPIAFLGGEHFTPALLDWARAEARVMRFEDDVAANGEFDAEGQERPVTRLLAIWSARAEGKRQRLGLDPMSLARLRRDLVEANRQEPDMLAQLAEARRVS